MLRYIGRRRVHNEGLRKYIEENTRISKSTVFQGTLYEHTVMRELRDKLLIEKMEMCGGSYDAGVDIKGKWPLNKIYDAVNSSHGLTKDVPKRISVNGCSFKPLKHKLMAPAPFKPLNVLVQCKAFKNTKITGREMRELMGTYSLNVPSNKRNQTVFIMSAPNLLTRDGLLVMNSLAIPLIYARIEMLKSHQGWYDLEYSGKLQNYYENEYASKLLDDCGIHEWLKSAAYKNYSDNA
ncbi:LAFE_0A03554g1_1 [Lachancea fermentati]|uniref:Required for respiratory growth protein 7, mitochondrial n=1 Tax=Lachancea fermentati TaxID=4955 RepID=A0A1G4M6S6_LACFM|nr:LAFE_0A03554g1_1 [Lachancea fermentati]